MPVLSNYKFNQLDDLFLFELKDLYDSERRLLEALPKMVQAASSAGLKSAFTRHLKETEDHAQRLETIFGLIGHKPERETCAAMKGLISEGSDMINAEGNPNVRDAALIAAAQRVEHYEMAAYGAARTFARHLGLNDVAQTLQRTLNEEGEANKVLIQLAEQGGINAATVANAAAPTTRGWDQPA